MNVFDWIDDNPGKGAVAIFAAIGLTFLLMFCVCYQLDRFSCRRLGEAASVKTKFDYVAGGCFVRLNGRWVPAKVWRGIE